MTRIVLIHAGPTQWDVEDRIVGNHPLPLTDLARATVQGVIAKITHAVSAVYRFKKNEACDEVARMVAKAFKIRTSDSSALDEMNLGLWQGLTRSELQFRYPKVVEQWKENPLSVQPPEGESLPQAIERLEAGLKRILRRNRGVSVVLALRPIAMQMMLGLLRGEQPLAIVAHLQQSSPVETIDISDEELHRFIT